MTKKGKELMILRWRKMKLTAEIITLAVGLIGLVLAVIHLFDAVTMELWIWCSICIIGTFSFLDIRENFTFFKYVKRSEKKLKKLLSDETL